MQYRFELWITGHLRNWAGGLALVGSAWMYKPTDVFDNVRDLRLAATSAHKVTEEIYKLCHRRTKIYYYSREDVVDSWQQVDIDSLEG